MGCTASGTPRNIEIDCRNQRGQDRLEAEFCSVLEYPWPPAPIGKAFCAFPSLTHSVALYPARSDSEKISFNQINRNTGHRIKYMKVDADTGEEVSNDDIMKGYKVDTDTYIEVSKDELENIALESTRTIDCKLNPCGCLSGLGHARLWQSVQFCWYRGPVSSLGHRCVCKQ
jgi:hypothetical protein